MPKLGVVRKIGNAQVSDEDVVEISLAASPVPDNKSFLYNKMKESPRSTYGRQQTARPPHQQYKFKNTFSFLDTVQGEDSHE